MTSTCTAATKHNFYCVVKACLELINLPLIDILATYVKDVDLFNRINSCPNLLSGRYKLRIDQQKICYLTPPAVPDYKKFDVTLLYTLIRNLCPFLIPTQGWGHEPNITDTKLGDDIERLRLFRNNYCAHAVFEEIPDTEFEILWRNLKSVINRIQSKTSVNYEQELIKIENSKFDHKYLEKCEVILKALLILQTEDKDEPDVVINGKDEVICGEPARFEAVLQPDSPCWSITWQKRRENDIQKIDTSKTKYSGSTNRKLVIKSACKEDEGEYQILLSHISNGNGYLKYGPTFCLHVCGELPHLNDLEVTTEDEGIMIHCSFYVPGQWPEVQHIEWSKNDGKVLDKKTYKFLGGSIHEDRLAIRLPTDEYKGKYSCKITNAVGSVSKNVMLDIPSVTISVNPTVCFGCKATITANVSSTPSAEHVTWQKSKDGNDFHCIDITKPKYYGSNDTPFQPLLVIPKASFEDKLYYRLLVKNKITESISDKVYLNVTGSRPNIMISQETNTKNRMLKLIGNVSLFDGSPDIHKVFWTKNGKRIDTQGSGGRLSEENIENPYLIIKHVTVEDAGKYQCTAVNAVGSTTSDVIVLDIPEVIVKKEENKEDGIQKYFVTIRSVPTPFYVQWSSKGRNEEIYTPIEVNEEDYKDTVNTLPHPVLVVKKNQLDNNSYQIEVENFIGRTVKQILEEESRPGNITEGDQSLPGNRIEEEESRPGNITEGDQSLPGNRMEEEESRPGNITEGDQSLPGNRIEENRTNERHNFLFIDLCLYLMEHFPMEKLETLKMILLADGNLKNVTSLKTATSTQDVLCLIVENKLLNEYDVLFMQYICKRTDCKELALKCTEYALTQERLCFFQTPTENGFEDIWFHIEKKLLDYAKQKVNDIVEFVAKTLGCSKEEILPSGILPWASFFLVVSVKKGTTWKLQHLNGEDRLRLTTFNIDFFVVDGEVVILNNLEDNDARNNQDMTVADMTEYENALIFVSKQRLDNEMGAYKCNPEYYLASDPKKIKEIERADSRKKVFT